MRTISKTFQRTSITEIAWKAGRVELAASNSSRLEAIAMAKQKKPAVRRESGLTVADEEAETKAIGNWLRTVDKPLAKGKQGREDPEPSEE